MVPVVSPSKDVMSFGPFRLAPGERLLTREGVPVELGARAFDILIALVARPNEIISKKELLSHVWPDVTVEESSLRFHMASLRKALGDGKGGARYITTLAGRGYCFVAPVSQLGDQDPAAGAVPESFPHNNLPGRPTHMVGRDEDVLRISNHLIDARFVSIVGIGGVGKTTVAIAVGHHLIETFKGAALFVDLSVLSDPGLVVTAIASMLGLSVQSEDATPALIAHLRSKRMLLILDTCEHLIDAVATLTSTIFAEAPQVHILATSREVLRVRGEHVYRLDTLTCPPENSKTLSAAAQEFPEPRLFIQRAAASGASLDLSDAEVAVVVRICRKLDGVALAIELAARRVQAYGLHQTEALLDQRLTLSWLGPRTATPRQRTLQATLDWSYQLLPALERLVLRRLAVFVGHFTLDAALAVVASSDIGQSMVFEAIDSLVAKSMVAPRPVGAMMRYRLLDTTRAYLREVDIDAAEQADLAARHAVCYRQWLDRIGAESTALRSGTEREPYLDGLGNVRVALDWCFGTTGNVELAVSLAAAAAPVFFTMSLLPECRRWSERALLALDGDSRGGREEMQLQASLGLSLMFTRGQSNTARAALNRSVAIAKSNKDLLNELRLLGPLHMYHLRGGDFKAALQYAKRSSEIARTLGETQATALAHAMLGISLHIAGSLNDARAELEAALEFAPESSTGYAIHFGFDYYRWADMALTAVLWLTGYPAQAATRARHAINDAERMQHPVSLAIVLNAITVLLWVGDVDDAERHLDWFVSRSESQEFTPYLDVGQGLRGEIAIRRGEFKRAIAMLQDCLEKLRATRYERFATRFNIVLIRGFMASGRFVEGLDLVDETIRQTEVRGDTAYVPELLRLKGGIMLAMPNPDEDAESYFIKSLEMSRTHGSRALELRTATDLAALWTSQGRSDEARALLLPTFEQFTEGLDTADLRAALRLLETLG